MLTKETFSLRADVTSAGMMFKKENMGASSHFTGVVLFSVNYSFLDDLPIDASIWFLSKSQNWAGCSRMHL